MTEMRGLGILPAVLVLYSCLVLGCSDAGNGAAGNGGHSGTAGGSDAGGHAGQAQAGAGGSAGVGPGGSGGGARGGTGGAAGGAAGCSGSPFFCAAGSGISCSDAGGAFATCVSGQWSCPGGLIPSSQCKCTGAPPPGCSCGSSGWVCSTPDGGAGGSTGGTGGGRSGGTGGAAGQGGGGAPGCAALTTLQTCDARSDCHAVFEDLGTCGCGSPGCCAHFARCADGDRASCTPAALLCKAAQPFCEQPYVVGYVGSCYEGCVRASECMGAGGSGGGAGAGGTGGGGAGGRAGAGGGGGSTSCNADPSVCGPSGVCLRKQVIGGVCLFADGGCQPGYSAAGQCCVMDPVYTCVPRPSSCTGDVTCTCAASTLCAGGYTCMSSRAGEIACTLLAP
jgi:hypothetical protein